MKQSTRSIASGMCAFIALAGCTSTPNALVSNGSGYGPAHLAITPVPDSYRCGDEVFRVAFEEGAAYATLPDRSTVTLPRIRPAGGSDPEAPRVFSNGRLMFTQEIEGGRAVRFARGRMAPVLCERLATTAEWKQLPIPVTIESSQEITTVPAGWRGFVAAVPIQVSGITVFDGRPERRVSLAPNNEAETPTKRTLVHTWRLAPSSVEGSWLAVSYSATAAVLARQLAQGTTDLRIIYDRVIAVDGLPKVIRVEYR